MDVPWDEKNPNEAKTPEPQLEVVDLVVDAVLKVDQTCYREMRESIMHDSSLRSTKMAHDTNVATWLASTTKQRLTDTNLARLKHVLEEHKDCQIHLDLDYTVLYVALYMIR